MKRGEIWWADLPDPRGSETGFRRPVLIIQSNPFNRSEIRTTIVAVITSNLLLAEAPGNVVLPAESSGLTRDSVVNVSQILTLDRSFLTETVGQIPDRLLAEVDAGLRLVLHLQDIAVDNGSTISILGMQNRISSMRRLIQWSVLPSGL